MADLGRDHAYVVPTIVGPQRAHHCGEEARDSADARHTLADMRDLSRARKNSERDDAPDQSQFHRRYEHLYIAARSHAGVVYGSEDEDAPPMATSCP